jgi:hypothetical protein
VFVSKYHSANLEVIVSNRLINSLGKWQSQFGRVEPESQGTPNKYSPFVVANLTALELLVEEGGRVLTIPPLSRTQFVLAHLDSASLFRGDGR